MSLPEEYQTRISSCVYAIEATSCEELDIWSRFSDPSNPRNYDKQYEWKNKGGWLETVGHINDRPICFSVMVVEIDGHDILMRHATSQLVDYKMIDEWFEKNAPTLQKTDAMNAHHAIHEIDKLNKETIWPKK